jgi:heme exporter protein A
LDYTAQGSTKTLNVEALDVWRGDRCLIQGLSFRTGPGEAALVTGPNGAGKTTLLRILAGLSPAVAGSVTWGERAVHALPFEARGEVAYRGHLDGLKKDLSVTENLGLYCALWGGTDAVDDLLAAVGLTGLESRRFRSLSAGQKRRLGLAALRAQQAQLWILDEPMTNLDAAGRALVVEWVRAHLAAGGSAVVATHAPEEFAGAATLAVEL